MYLNFDMVGSPNHVFFIYDGDDSDAVGAGPGPAGSAQIEETFEGFFTSRGLPYKGTDFTGRSDYGPFIAAKVPSGGLFTGAEGIKTARRPPSGAVPPAWHTTPATTRLATRYANNNDMALANNSDAIAHSVITLRDEHRAHQRHEVEGQLQAARRRARARRELTHHGSSLPRPARRPG